ncbi:hypothetical protein BSZ35_08970 [Salinibacter sp. 10B]|nr:hypothetical protein BSZ35_08970 [Salinibacter sp. 10B]
MMRHPFGSDEESARKRPPHRIVLAGGEANGTLFRDGLVEEEKEGVASIVPGGDRADPFLRGWPSSFSLPTGIGAFAEQSALHGTGEVGQKHRDGR